RQTSQGDEKTELLSQLRGESAPTADDAGLRWRVYLLCAGLVLDRAIGAEARGVSAPVLNDLGGDLVGQFGVVAEVLLGILPSLAQPEVAVVEPRTRLLDELVGDGQIEDVSFAGDPTGVHHIKLADPEGRCDLVLDNLGLDPRPGHLLAILDRSDPPDIDPCRAVELQGPAAGGGLRAAEHDADLLAKLVDEYEHALGPRDSAGELAQGLAHQPRLQAHVAVANFTLELGPGNQCRDRVDDHDIDSIGQHQHFGDIERVLGVDERGDSPVPLGIGHRVQRDGRLAAGLRSEELDDSPSRQPSASQGQVERQRPGRDTLHVEVASLPSFMIAPAPNVFSIWLIALFSALVSADTVAGLSSVVPCRLATTIAPSFDPISVRKNTIVASIIGRGQGDATVFFPESGARASWAYAGPSGVSVEAKVITSPTRNVPADQVR